MWGRFATCLFFIEKQVVNLLHIEQLPKTSNGTIPTPAL